MAPIQWIDLVLSKPAQALKIAATKDLAEITDFTALDNPERDAHWKTSY